MNNDFYASTMLAVRKVQEDTGLTMAEILALPADEYARLTGRPTTSEIAVRAAGIEPAPPVQDQAPAAPQPAPQPPAPEHPGIDVASLSLDQY